MYINYFYFKKCVNFSNFLIIQKVLINLYYFYFQFSSNTFIDFIPNDNDINKNNNSSISNYNIEAKKQSNINNQEIIELTKELNNEKQKNINLNNQLNNLYNQLNLEKQKNKNLYSQLNSYKKQVEQLNSKINSLEKSLDLKNLEIQNLINYYNNELKKLSQSTSRLEFCKTGEKIMAIHFTSTDGKVNLALPCKNTDIFVRLEEKLYNEYPEYKDVNTYFTVGGNIVKRFKTMKENNIKNTNAILLNIYEQKIN